MKLGVSFILVVISLIQILAAEEKYILTPDEAIVLAIKNNFQLRESNFNILTAEESLKQIKAQYEPAMTLNVSKTDSKSSGANPLYGTKTARESVIAGASKKFNYTGGYLSLSWKNEKTDNNSIFMTTNPLYDSEIEFSYLQPLLNNVAGINDKRSLNISESSKNISELYFVMKKNWLVNQIKKSYLSLGFALKSLEVQKLSLERSKKLLAINKDKFIDGLLEEVDVIANEAAVTLREASILVAENSVKDAKDNLRRIIGIQEGVSCHFITNAKKKFNHKEIVVEEIVDKALSKRPELIIIEKTIEINEINREIRKNEKLPSLDLTTQYGLGNSSENWSNNYESISKADNPVWYVGLSLTAFPLNKMKKSLLMQNEYEYLKNKASLKDKKLEIVTECKRIVRKTNTQALYVEAARKSLEMQKKKLKLEKVKFNQGRSSIHWLLSYEDDFNNAEIEYYRAMVDYYKAVADIKFITGEIK